jgi:hypothetical protein
MNEVMQFTARSMETGAVMGTGSVSSSGEVQAMFEKYPNCSFLYHGVIPGWFNARRKTAVA